MNLMFFNSIIMNAKEQLVKEIEQADDSQVEYLLNLFLSMKKSAAVQSESEVQPISTDDNVEQANTDRNSRPIWELFIEAANSLPPEALEGLPWELLRF
ncbi:hypothetical protein BCD67_22280 [Oscillatoriales cyanobacterium USR001]|nr:hypothetical protein BCD67_22280 [Oscillatoriales cyanobacterium USR001]